MRHAVFGRVLNRDTKSRKALLVGLSSNLILNGNITITLAKAKFIKPFVEKLITKAKQGSLYSDRHLVSALNKQAFSKLISEIGPGFRQRPGGYTRIIKLTPRHGDASPMAKIEMLPLDKTKTEKPKKARQEAKSQKMEKEKVGKSTQKKEKRK